MTTHWIVPFRTPFPTRVAYALDALRAARHSNALQEQGQGRKAAKYTRMAREFMYSANTGNKMAYPHGVRCAALKG